MEGDFVDEGLEAEDAGREELDIVVWGGRGEGIGGMNLLAHQLGFIARGVGHLARFVDLWWVRKLLPLTCHSFLF